MPEPPDFEQIAGDTVPPIYRRQVAEQLRQVWNARCAIAAAEARVRQPQTEALARLEGLGRAGLTVSVCCGPCGTAPFRWTVQVLSREGEEFDQPFAANDFGHAIEIATLESQPMADR